MPKKNLTTILLIGSTFVVVAVALVLASLLKTDEAITPKPSIIKASPRTYSKLLALNRVAGTPTPGPTSPPTPTEFSVIITPVLTSAPTPSATESAMPTSLPVITAVQELPESGIVGFSAGAFILALTFIVAAFLF